MQLVLFPVTLNTYGFLLGYICLWTCSFFSEYIIRQLESYIHTKCIYLFFVIPHVCSFETYTRCHPGAPGEDVYGWLQICNWSNDDVRTWHRIKSGYKRVAIAHKKYVYITHHSHSQESLRKSFVFWLTRPTVLVCFFLLTLFWFAGETGLSATQKKATCW
jgi:hypothetical protein